jgi:hypothetical protein
LTVAHLTSPTSGSSTSARVAGAGFATDAGLALALRYARSFNTLIDSTYTKNEPKAFNNAFTLQMGYLLPFGRYVF